MLLSMWIINDYLSDLSPRAHIVNGRPELSGARILTDSNVGSAPYVFLARSQDFISTEKGNVICVHGEDTIVLQTDDIDMVFNQVLECFDYYNRWEASCLEVIGKGCTIDELLGMPPAPFRDDLFVAGRNGYILAWARPEGDRALDDDGLKNREFWTQLFADRILPVKNRMYLCKYAKQHFMRRCTVVSPGDELRPAILRPLFNGDQVWGALIQANVFTPASKTKMQLLDMLAVIIERYLQADSRSGDQVESLVDLCQKALRDGDTSLLPSLQEQLAYMLWQPDDPKDLYRIASIDGDTELFPALCIHLNKMSGCLAFPLEDCAVVVRNDAILPDREFEPAFHRLLADANCLAGTGRQFRDIEDLLNQRDLARMALAYGDARKGAVHRIDDWILDYLRDTLQANCKVDYRHPAIAILDEYDAENDMELKATLHAFLLSGRNFAKTGKRMFLHRNTVQYRIEKACEICGLDLEDDQSNLHLLVSLWLDG